MLLGGKPNIQRATVVEHGWVSVPSDIDEASWIECVTRFNRLYSKSAASAESFQQYQRRGLKSPWLVVA